MLKKILFPVAAMLIWLLIPRPATAQAIKTQTTQVGADVVKVYEPWQIPLSNYKLTQKFNVFHPGMDLAAPVGTPVLPVVSGTVAQIEKKSWGYGYNILISHGDGYSTLYAHLSKIIVAEGELVNKQTTIGATGSTGNSTGPHLHFEVRQDDKQLSPTNFLEF